MTLIAAQGMVQRFHEIIDSEIGTRPGFRGVETNEMRSSLIQEEANETIIAIEDNDFPAAVDGLCDLIYVCLGAAITWGVDLDPIFRAVHATNMAKAGGPRRADGKILKPEGWVPPDVAGLLRAQGWTP